MFDYFTSIDPGSTIESLATQIKSPLDWEHNSLTFAPLTLQTRMDIVTELQ